jgi:hypothetical protein
MLRKTRMRKECSKCKLKFIPSTRFTKMCDRCHKEAQSMGVVKRKNGK